MAKHDLFVSYAHEQDPKWVSLLVQQLEYRVSTLLGEAPRFYFDPFMEQGVFTQSNSIDAVRGSRLLLVILTPRYLASAWCRMELETFLDAGGDTAEHRIFIVEAERIEREQWPAPLRDKESIAFWAEDAGTRIPERLDPELGEQHAQTFRRRVGEIAHFVAARLKESPFAVDQYKGDVWIAEPTDDLVDEWEDLAAVVRQADWRALPASPYPTHDRDAYTNAVRNHLESAQLFVQLLGPRAGRKPPWDGAQYPLLQAREARAVVQKRPRVRWLRWRKASPAPDDSSPYAALLREGDVQHSSFGSFKDEVLRYLTTPEGPLRALASPEPDLDSDAVDGSDMPAPDLGSDEYFFISYTRSDVRRVAPILHLLRKSGHRFWYDKGIAGGAEWDAEIEARLRSCRGVVFLSSQAAIKSRYVRREVKFADRLEKPLIPIKLEDTVLSEGMDILLTQYQMLDPAAPDFARELDRALQRAVVA
jgi:hypothetical protein